MIDKAQAPGPPSSSAAPLTRNLMARGPTVGVLDVSTLDFCTFVHREAAGYKTAAIHTNDTITQ
jgi:hypothetical protein